MHVHVYTDELYLSSCSVLHAFFYIYSSHPYHSSAKEGISVRTLLREAILPSWDEGGEEPVFTEDMVYLKV